jgi:acyl CoA:acetate/3-ketoacid CoA transferase alpha subunit
LEAKKDAESASFSGEARNIIADFVGKGRDYVVKAEEIVTAAEQEPEKYPKRNMGFNKEIN